MIAATFTPMHPDGSLNLALIPPMMDHLAAQGITGIYVLGSTGEGVSLTHDERCRAAEAFVQAASDSARVIVQVGSESLAQAGQLAAHAMQIGADAISAVSPVYFKPESVETLVACMAQIASHAPELPFYYYHIPGATGVQLSMLEFLRQGESQIPTLRGLKFTSPRLDEFQACLQFGDGRYDVLWGLDEMLLGGLSAGARAAIGSTYNFAAPIYRQLMSAFAEGDIEAARLQQARSQAIVRTFVPYGPRAAQKAIMAMTGIDCGPTRLPVAPLSEIQAAALHQELLTLGFFDWIAPLPTAADRD